ncbi:Flp family type IVb pilin [Streptosporangium sp. NPDC002721]|uniref:Flp family type IVb pilin n=1 Tax=Streptosporangium sp. NPDC002721 TaxID=3366188 RepID=UPI0036AA9CCF
MLSHPWIVYATAVLSVRIEKARSAPTRGASAVEWVIITAIIAGVALGLATLIKTLVEGKQAEISNQFGGGGGGGGGGGELGDP